MSPARLQLPQHHRAMHSQSEFQCQDQFTATETVVVGEGVDGAVDGVRVGLLVQEVAKIQGELQRAAAERQAAVKQNHCLGEVISNLVTGYFRSSRELERVTGEEFKGNVVALGEVVFADRTVI